MIVYIVIRDFRIRVPVWNPVVIGMRDFEPTIGAKLVIIWNLFPTIITEHSATTSFTTGINPRRGA